MYMGFDYGKRFIGVAVGHELTLHAQALTVISAKKGVPDWQAIDKLVKQWKPLAFVVGYPLNMDGTTQGISKATLVFQRNLEKRYSLKCHLTDERLSTYEAIKNLSSRNIKKEQIDSESAAIILKQWLQQNLGSNINN